MSIKRLFTIDLKSKNKSIVKKEKKRTLELIKNEKKEAFVKERLVNKDINQNDLTLNLEAAIKQARRLNRKRK